ncbi:4Fe-4S binding protein [Polaromonas sp. P2-4]|nr:4Fe-4S binding protein [Polaromonas sp. P2-4]
MAYVITEGCIDCKDGACVSCCPVDCIYEGGRTFYIHPDECISCGICVSVCPTDAIYEDVEVPQHLRHFIGINREFFGPQVSGLGSPGGASSVGPKSCDHPLVAAAAQSAADR